MKSTERHKLKENEFARTVARTREVFRTRSAQIRNVVFVLVLVAAAVGVYAWWRNTQEGSARAKLAEALATYEMPVVPTPPPAPGSPPPLPRPGTFQTEEERLNAALPKFLEAANTNPDSPAALTARFHAAAILAAQGKPAEAESHYRQVIEKTGSSIYGRTARLGLAEALAAQGKLEEAIAIYSDLSRDTNSTLPLDGVLMQLGRTFARAGKKDDAVRSFSRIVDEFPQSPYVADARRELEEAKRRS